MVFALWRSTARIQVHVRLLARPPAPNWKALARAPRGLAICLYAFLYRLTCFPQSQKTPRLRYPLVVFGLLHRGASMNQRYLPKTFLSGRVRVLVGDITSQN